MILQSTRWWWSLCSTAKLNFFRLNFNSFEFLLRRSRRRKDSGKVFHNLLRSPPIPSLFHNSNRPDYYSGISLLPTGLPIQCWQCTIKSVAVQRHQLNCLQRNFHLIVILNMFPAPQLTSPTQIQFCQQIGEVVEQAGIVATKTSSNQFQMFLQLKFQIRCFVRSSDNSFINAWSTERKSSQSV